VRRNPSFKEIVVGNRICASVAKEILLSRQAVVLWKMGIVCAIPGLLADFMPEFSAKP
jgi:hypothetical protein